MIKPISLVFLILVATAAFAQSSGVGSVLSNEPQRFDMPSHPQRATSQPLGQFQTLLEQSTFSYAQGERPLWEFAPKEADAVPLGDIARMLRKDRATLKKAEKVWTN